MKLFHYLIKNRIAFKTDPFTALLLKRLSIMEALAAVKFKTMPIEDYQRESIIFDDIKNRCLDADYSMKKTDITLNLFMENVQLAKSIQMACFNEWKTLSVDTVSAMGLASARAIISAQLLPQTLLISIREYISNITNLMFNTLPMIKITPEPTEIIEPLLLCFPNINQKEIKKSGASITENMIKLMQIIT